VWTLGYAGREVRLRDSKGLRDLHALLSRPGTAMAALDLAGGALKASTATTSARLTRPPDPPQSHIAVLIATAMPHRGACPGWPHIVRPDLTPSG
jgi:hypothetical protein